jgi:hypothetical protein
MAASRVPATHVPYLKDGTTHVPRGYLAVTCWCEEHIVAVPERDVANGHTRSCGLPECRPPFLVGIA